MHELAARTRAAHRSGCRARRDRAAACRRQRSNRDGWAVDIFAAFEALSIRPTPENICAVIAVTEQESTFQANPSVPGLPAIARREIDSRAARYNIPKLVVNAALELQSPTGKTLSRAARQGEDRERAERHLRGLHRHGAARRAPVRQPEPGAHRRADAGEHRVRRRACRGEALSLSAAGHAFATKCSRGAAACTSASRTCSTTRRTTTTCCSASPTSTPATTRAATRRFRTR